MDENEIPADRGRSTQEPLRAPEESRPSDIELLRRDVEVLRAEARSAQAERDAAIAAIQAESDTRLIRSELRMIAMKSGIIDVDALRLLDPSDLRVGADGAVDGAEDAIAALKVSKPYLFEEGRSALAGPTTSPPRRVPAPARPDPVDARTLSREQWQTERARVLAQGR